MADSGKADRLFLEYPILRRQAEAVLGYVSEWIPTLETAELSEEQRVPLVHVCCLLAIRRALLARRDGGDEERVKDAFMEGLSRRLFEVELFAITSSEGQAWDPLAIALPEWANAHGRGVMIERRHTGIARPEVHLNEIGPRIVAASQEDALYAVKGETR